MTVEGSVTQWITDLKGGDNSAAQRLWARYVDQLARLARQKLGATPRRVADEDDVVVTAFEHFCRGMVEGRFPRINDRHDLWQILVMLTQRKATDQIRRSLTRRKFEVGESHLARPESSNDSHAAGTAQVPGADPTPEFAVQVAEEFGRLLDALDDATLRQIAQWKLEGYTNDEIAGKMGCVTRTIERKLELIRQRWESVGVGPGGRG